MYMGSLRFLIAFFLIALCLHGCDSMPVGKLHLDPPALSQGSIHTISSQVIVGVCIAVVSFIALMAAILRLFDWNCPSPSNWITVVPPSPGGTQATSSPVQLTRIGTKPPTIPAMLPKAQFARTKA
ncbi:hypothetical protein BDN72DRAFT_838763 [Pluteus cervinus]|uniref:Uncharacterized protein n=1 Tax=Pluteus cervinus TaxID=181527 RepID=A0ACD3AXK7_9AGAR|nr:hypothetical protein BDN72DRAFT_838763 [Pluteus cervinus]